MYYSHFGNEVCVVAISISYGVFLNTYYHKVNTIGQWGKILVTVMGLVHTFEHQHWF